MQVKIPSNLSVMVHSNSIAKSMKYNQTLNYCEQRIQKFIIAQ